MNKFRFAVLCSGFLALLSSFAQAQPADAAPQWDVRVGGGFLYAPSFAGSKDYQLLLLPNIEIGYGDVFEASVQRGLRYKIPLAGKLAFGPIAKLDFGRKEDGSRAFRVAGKRTTALLGMGDIGETIEVGGFLDFLHGPLTASLELRHGVNGHKGLIGEARINYTWRSSVQRIGTILSFGPSLTFSNGKHAQAYFGVSAEQSLGSGLPMFNAGAGINSYGIGSTAVFLFHPRLSATLLAGYDRLTGDAKRSPLVAERGSANQVTAGLFLTYRLFQ
jgi:outer membrane protein